MQYYQSFVHTHLFLFSLFLFLLFCCFFSYYLHIDIWDTYQSVCIMCHPHVYGKNVIHKNDVANTARSKIIFSKVILEINFY